MRFLPSDSVDLYEFGASGKSADCAAGKNNIVARLQIERFYCGFACVVEQDIRRIDLLAENRENAPGERELIPHALICRNADNINGHAETRDHAHGSPGQGADDDSLGVDVDSHAAGSVRDSVAQILYLETGVLEALYVVDMLFRLLCDRGHGLHGLHRVFAGGGFPGEHYGAASVIYGVCHVGDLGAGGTGIVYHGFKHLRGGYYALAKEAALCDKVFLDRGKLSIRDLYAEVAAAYHNAFTFAAYVLYIVNAGLVLDFCDYVDISSAVFFQKSFHVGDILAAGDE